MTVEDFDKKISDRADKLVKEILDYHAFVAIESRAAEAEGVPIHLIDATVENALQKFRNNEASIVY